MRQVDQYPGQTVMSMKFSWTEDITTFICATQWE